MEKGLIREKSKDLLQMINNPKEFVKKLHEILSSTGEKKYRTEYTERFIPGIGESFGTPIPILRSIANEIGKFGQKNPKKILSILSLLWRNGSFEERTIVAKSLEKVGKVDYKGSLDLISSFLKDISDWATCDQLACFGIKSIITLYPEKVLPLSTKWSKDENKWIRRFGVVTLRALANDKKYQISKKEFDVIELVMKDSEPDVKKAAAWILRDMTLKAPQKVFKFLMKWAEEPNKNSRWIVKNGMKKLLKEDQEKILSALQK